MEMWIWWLALAIGLGLLEMLTLDLTLLMLGGGAAAGAIASALGAPLWLSVLIAAVVGIGLLAVVRPAAMRHRRQPAETRTGAAALVGASALVMSEVTRDHGYVQLAGDRWTARSQGDVVIGEGQHVKVVAIEGATAVVIPE
jgi:membrane protein implicated in regulation of membrane protease activity